MYLQLSKITAPTSLWAFSEDAMETDYILKEGQRVEIFTNSISKILVGIFKLAWMCSGSYPWGKKYLSAFGICSQF